MYRCEDFASPPKIGSSLSIDMHGVNCNLEESIAAYRRALLHSSMGPKTLALMDCLLS